MRTTIAVTFLSLVLCKISYAAPAPFGEWLMIAVESCQPVLFETPDDPERAKAENYQPGEKIRVGLIKGTVVSAKNFTNDGSWTFNFPPPAKEKIGTTFVGFSRAVDQACPKSIPSQAPYVSILSCDAGWRRGLCIVPLREVQLLRGGETFYFVQDSANNVYRGNRPETARTQRPRCNSCID